ncbi:MAG TPA: hypothetical protein VES19_06975 [Candidatus Limnocylindrales bacterium]|nr:hypothetical protein [Candidatus Limnocylindrales bacterium]
MPTSAIEGPPGPPGVVPTVESDAGTRSVLSPWVTLPKASCTTTVPCIDGWIVHQYVKVPAVANVIERVAPLTISPVAPSTRLAVCHLES